MARNAHTFLQEGMELGFLNYFFWQWCLCSCCAWGWGLCCRAPASGHAVLALVLSLAPHWIPSWAPEFMLYYMNCKLENGWSIDTCPEDEWPCIRYSRLRRAPWRAELEVWNEGRQTRMGSLCWLFISLPATTESCFADRLWGPSYWPQKW